jgi:transcriptional regulator with XRE-family HTH domain
MSTRELGELLRARREALDPAAAGFPPGTRRRTPGLRREELAMLAGISPTYLAFLEQGRDVHPSRQVLDALARALGLTEAEREYVHTLVHGAEAPELEETLDPEVDALVQRLDPHPTYVTGRRWDVLTANRAAKLLWTDWEAEPDRNLVLWMFASPKARAVFVEWEAEAAAQLARYRAASARHVDSPSFRALNERLLAVSEEARRLWPRHAVAPLGSGSKLLRHPELGVLRLHHTVLQVADDPEQKLVTFRPEPGDAERIAAKLRVDR